MRCLALILVLIAAGIVYASPGTSYLWAVVPSRIEADWLDHPQADTVCAQIRCYETDSVGANERDVSAVTATGWVKMWTNIADDGLWPVYRTSTYSKPTYANGGN